MTWRLFCVFIVKIKRKSDFMPLRALMFELIILLLLWAFFKNQPNHDGRGLIWSEQDFQAYAKFLYIIIQFSI